MLSFAAYVAPWLARKGPKTVLVDSSRYYCYLKGAIELLRAGKIILSRVRTYMGSLQAGTSNVREVSGKLLAFGIL